MYEIQTDELQLSQAENELLNALKKSSEIDYISESQLNILRKYNKGLR